MLLEKFSELIYHLQNTTYDEFEECRTELREMLVKADEIIANDPTVCKRCLSYWPETEKILANGELGCSCGNLTPAAPDLATPEYTGCGDPTCLHCIIEHENKTRPNCAWRNGTGQAKD